MTTAPSRVASRPVLAAWTAMPPVTASGTRSLRRTVASTVPVAAAVRTGRMRCTMASAVVGSLASSPNMAPTGRRARWTG
ncbi:hypothetical protein ACU635_26450 [[Actinomadura] parvosata]|uniref:hypothetical protein n=1 Tax=[Actinomadura] parvosata TaxID=1955412 RepID=UPI00406D2577